MEQQSGSPISQKHIILLAAGGLGLLSLGVGAGYILSQGVTSSTSQIPQQVQQEMSTNNTNTGVSEEMNSNANEQISSNINEIRIENMNSNAKIENSNMNTVKKENSKETSILWSTPKKISELHIIQNKNTFDTPVYNEVGQVQGGKYDGYSIVILTQDEGIAGTGIFRFLKKDAQLVLLNQHSRALEDTNIEFKKGAFLQDKVFTIPELLPPTTLRAQNGGTLLERLEWYTEPFSLKDVKEAFVDPKYGKVYTSIVKEQQEDGKFTGNGFYLPGPDNIASYYAMTIPFVPKDSSLPNITWENGKKNTEEYNSTDIGGCGSINIISVVHPNKINKERDLVPVGRTSNGVSVDFFKNLQHPILKKVYEDEYTVFDGQKMSYEAFLEKFPLFFWVDPFGRLIKFQGNQFLPPVECGKPVIYLYPQKDMDVTVEVNPLGGFTKTEPEYGTGWDVHATTTSVITDKKTGLQYPYLFWEGRGGVYKTPDRGFMVKKADVHTFLVDALTKLGLNEKEQKDFMEFWEPKMQDSSYYFVSFVDTKRMDQLAPLHITPEPDTIIRVLMDFIPVNTPYSVIPQELKALPREGFTVIEWGGVLR